MCGKSVEHYTEFWRAVQEMWLRLYGSSMVTVAAVNVRPLGLPSSGGDCHLLLWTLWAGTTEKLWSKTTDKMKK